MFKRIKINHADEKGRRTEDMADRELRRLSRRELLQMLLVQCEESERLQQETDAMREQMDTVMESYGRLKKKLDIKDERLNQKDAKIAELNREIEELKEAKNRELNDAEVVAKAMDQLNEVFEEVQKSVEQYMAKVRKDNIEPGPFEMGRTMGFRKKQKEVLLAETAKASGEI